MFKKVLIANRGEIAVRIMRTCREMGIATVAVYSDVDRKALHVRYADEAYPIGPAPSTESYLRIDRVLQAAKRSGAQAIHPGYGFLAENPDFAQACEENQVIFIGPPVKAMELMGSKTASRKAVRDANLPAVPGTDRNLGDIAEVERIASEVGFPIMLKASAGGGGKGLRLVQSMEEMESAYRNARAEAQNAFNDPSIYIEKYINRPRHVEIQVLGDQHGNLIHLGERECSLQRRHQKVMEECPSPLLDHELRQHMGETAIRIARLAGYFSAGTVEFLVDQDRNFYFLEMNTRLQVEHPITELVVGIDIVREQLAVAAGAHLRWRQEDVDLRGSALECRIYAEDPTNNFFPSPGFISRHKVPAGPGVRLDSGVYQGWSVPLEYDPLLSKLAVWGKDRAEAIARMQRALSEYQVSGIQTTISLFQQILRHPEFLAAQIDTAYLDRALGELIQPADDSSSEAEQAALVAAGIETLRNQASPHLPKSAKDAWKSAGRETLLNTWPMRQRRNH